LETHVDIQAHVVALAECMSFGADRMACSCEFPLPIYFGQVVVLAATPKRLKAILHRSRAVLRMSGYREFSLQLTSVDRRTDRRFRAHVDWIAEGPRGRQVLFQTALYCNGVPGEATIELVQVLGLRQWREALRQGSH